jgi:hypothetical protein
VHAAETPRVVPFAELLEVMRVSRGYDPLATTNGARFQAQVLLTLARRARAGTADGPPLLVRHQDWYRALLDATGIPAERAPLYVQLAFRHGQDIGIEYRPEHVVREVVKGPKPVQALRVTISWPAAPGAASEYSYEDTVSTPHLKVTNKRVIEYQLLDFGDEVVFDEIEGLFGRPTSGALGLLFQVLGEGRVVQYRMAFAPDGTLVSRGRARKAFFEIATTVTVQPDGRSEKGVPPDPRLVALEERLKRPLEIRYQAGP